MGVRILMFTLGCSHQDVRTWMFASVGSHLDVRIWMFAVGCSHLDVHIWMFAVGCSRLDVRICRFALLSKAVGSGAAAQTASPMCRDGDLTPFSMTFGSLPI